MPHYEHIFVTLELCIQRKSIFIAWQSSSFWSWRAKDQPQIRVDQRETLQKSRYRSRIRTPKPKLWSFINHKKIMLLSWAHSQLPIYLWLSYYEHTTPSYKYMGPIIVVNFNWNAVSVWLDWNKLNLTIMGTILGSWLRDALPLIGVLK